MANPENTQQFRDRELELMFYDEAEVHAHAALLYDVEVVYGLLLQYWLCCAVLRLCCCACPGLLSW